MDNQKISGAFTVLRPFFIAGRRVSPGEIVELDDLTLIASLVDMKKITPDAATGARLGRKDRLEWSEARPEQTGVGVGHRDGSGGPWKRVEDPRSGLFRQ